MVMNANLGVGVMTVSLRRSLLVPKDLANGYPDRKRSVSPSFDRRFWSNDHASKSPIRSLIFWKHLPLRLWRELFVNECNNISCGVDQSPYFLLRHGFPVEFNLS